MSFPFADPHAAVHWPQWQAHQIPPRSAPPPSTHPLGPDSRFVAVDVEAGSLPAYPPTGVPVVHDPAHDELFAYGYYMPQWETYAGDAFDPGAQNSVSGHHLVSSRRY